ncbi:MAG: hypothetical protein JNL32_07635 [Candidatus Kapabacteria bacterium]|nr:hypothetical protein [Candidatus Kapabacteria bacterium]
MSYTISEQIAEVRRELAVRVQVNKRILQREPQQRKKLEHQWLAMRAVLETLESVKSVQQSLESFTE